jgi:hypothetical protein
MPNKEVEFKVERYSWVCPECTFTNWVLDIPNELKCDCGFKGIPARHPAPLEALDYDKVKDLVSLKLSQLIVDDKTDNLGYTKSGVIASAICQHFAPPKRLSVEEIIDLFKVFQLHEHFERTTKTGIPNWNYKDLAQAIRDAQNGERK